jgi:hypothetical protein
LIVVVSAKTAASQLLLSFHDHDYDQPRSTSAMALNWTMLKPDRTPVPLPGELTIMTVEPGVEVSLAVPDTPPSGSSTSGGSGGARKLNGTGKLFLTDQRVRFSDAVSVSEKLIRKHRTPSWFSSLRTTLAAQDSTHSIYPSHPYYQQGSNSLIWVQTICLSILGPLLMEGSPLALKRRYA